MLEKPSVEQQQTSTSEYHYESQKIEEFEKNSAPSYHSNGIEEDVENNIQAGTHRGLDARHIQMISLGGAIG
jgi:amino acid permease